MADNISNFKECKNCGNSNNLDAKECLLCFTAFEISNLENTPLENLKDKNENINEESSSELEYASASEFEEQIKEEVKINENKKIILDKDEPAINNYEPEQEEKNDIDDFKQNYDNYEISNKKTVDRMAENEYITPDVRNSFEIEFENGSLKSLKKECPSCKTENSQNAKFCLNCGTKIDSIKPIVENKQNLKSCPVCTFECEERLNFCPVCNHKYKIVENVNEAAGLDIDSKKSIFNENINNKPYSCPQCTFDCEEPVDVCPVCNYKFVKNYQDGNEKIISKPQSGKEKTAELINVLKTLEKTNDRNFKRIVKSQVEEDRSIIERLTIDDLNIQNYKILQNFRENLTKNKNEIKILYEKTPKTAGSTDLFVKELFKHIMSKIKNSHSKITHSGQVLAANLHSIINLANRKELLNEVTETRCEIFLTALKTHNDTELELLDLIEVLKNSKSIENCNSFMNIECGICFYKKTMNRILNLNCGCNICIDCFKDGYRIAIKSSEALISPNAFSCLVCKEPKFDPNNKHEFQLHLDFLTMLINTHMDKNDKEQFAKNLTELSIKDATNFIWCQHGCNNGYLADPVYYGQVLKIYCNICKKYTCFKCKEKWELGHEGKTCDEFKKWKVDNGITDFLKDNSITCPKCNTMFKLDKGGCLHYTCIKCKHEFCGACKCQMSTKAMSDCTDTCKSSGLHGHHPYNCYAYMRDFSVQELAKFLEENGKDLKLQENSKNLGCQYQETNTDGQNISCNAVVFDLNGTKIQLCETVEEKLDPLSLYEINALKIIMQRSRLSVPDVKSKDENELRKTYIQFIQKYIPRPDLSGNIF